LVDRIDRVGFGVLERRGGEPRELTLGQVERKLAAQRQLRQHGESANTLPMARSLVLRSKRRAQAYLSGLVWFPARSLSGSEIPADIVDGNDGLHQDVLADDVALAEPPSSSPPYACSRDTAMFSPTVSLFMLKAVLTRTVRAAAGCTPPCRPA